MRTEDFLAALKEYLDNGNNTLDEHAELTYLSWDLARHEEPFSIEEIKLIDDAINGETFWSLEDLYTQDEIDEILVEKKRSVSVWKYRNSYEYKRHQASLFTSDSRVRKNVFKTHGKVCKECGATTRLELDHIVPVIKGGKNTLDNLQVLCKSCNILKGSRVGDVEAGQ